MKTDLTLGYMPLTDSLPLLAAAQNVYISAPPRRCPAPGT